MQDRGRSILRTAYDIVGDRGLESLHARSVAAALNINHATVHYYFRTREDLLSAMADYALERLKADHKRFCSEASEPADVLEGEVALAEAYCQASSRFVRVVAALLTAAVEMPALRPKVQALWGEWRTCLVKSVKGAKGAMVEGTPFSNADLLAATLAGLGFAAQISGGQFDFSGALDTVFGSMFGS